MAHRLEADGYTVVQAGNYETAMEIFNLQGGKIDLLIADISLPGHNGCDLARNVLKIRPETRILFVSGHAGAEVVRFYGLSVADVHFLRKPFETASLLARVHRLMASHEKFEVHRTDTSQGAEGAD